MDEVEEISVCNGNEAADWVFQTRTAADLHRQRNYAGADRDAGWIRSMSGLCSVLIYSKQ